MFVQTYMPNDDLKRHSRSGGCFVLHNASELGLFAHFRFNHAYETSIRNTFIEKYVPNNCMGAHEKHFCLKTATNMRLTHSRFAPEDSFASRRPPKCDSLMVDSLARSMFGFKTAAKVRLTHGRFAPEEHFYFEAATKMRLSHRRFAPEKHFCLKAVTNMRLTHSRFVPKEHFYFKRSPKYDVLIVDSLPRNIIAFSMVTTMRITHRPFALEEPMC